MDTTSIIITITIAIFSAFLGWLFAWFYSNRKRLIINQKTVTVIKSDDNYKRLVVTYDNVAIKELKYTTINIKNIGNKAITRNNIIRFLLKVGNEESIFECDIKGKSNKDIKPTLERNSSSIISLSFELLEKNNEIQLTLLHNSKTIPILDAKVVETKTLIKDDYLSSLRAYYTVLIFSIIPLVMPILIFTQFPSMIKNNNFVGLIAFTSLAVALFVILILSIRRYLKEIIVLKRKRNAREKGIDTDDILVFQAGKTTYCVNTNNTHIAP